MTMLAVILACAAVAADLSPVGPPPEALRERLGLAPFYARHLDCSGLPILGSEKVSEYALQEAAYLIDHILNGRDDLRQAIAEAGVRVVVMAPDEYTTNVPEHSDLEPSSYWDRRARGLGATRQRPAVSCGAENLLGLPGDPYAAENILIHEFAHTIHLMGLDRVDPTFDDRLDAAYRAALEEGLWAGTYAATHRSEYWAEAVQSWFDTNREDDHDHNHVDTRAELRAYDPRLAALVEEVLGDPAWRYVPPAQRGNSAHLAGFDRAAAGRFAWPDLAPDSSSDPDTPR